MITKDVFYINKDRVVRITIHRFLGIKIFQKQCEAVLNYTSANPTF